MLSTAGDATASTTTLVDAAKKVSNIHLQYYYRIYMKITSENNLYSNPCIQHEI